MLASSQQESMYNDRLYNSLPTWPSDTARLLKAHPYMYRLFMDCCAVSQMFRLMVHASKKRSGWWRWLP